MESAGVRYLRTSCFCIRNLTRSLRSLVRFLIRQKLVRKYRTPAVSMKYSLYTTHAQRKNDKETKMKEMEFIHLSERLFPTPF